MAQQRTYYVYIMASKSRVPYIGVTGFLCSECSNTARAKAESSHAVTASIVGCISKAFTTSETLLHGKRN